MRYIIPADLECERCTLQWYWPTANTCTLDDDVAAYWQQLGREPPTGWPGKHMCKNGQHGEEFWNCADITVKKKTGRGGPELEVVVEARIVVGAGQKHLGADRLTVVVADPHLTVVGAGQKHLGVAEVVVA